LSTCREQDAAFVDGEVSLVDNTAGQRGQMLKGHTLAIIAIAFSADGGTLASGG
jgi:hypothetical protein